MKIGPYLIIAMVIMGIYLLPSVLAKFAGSHSIEVNQTDGVTALKCTACHEYIMDELSQSTGSATLQTHLNAEGNNSYTWYWLERNLTNQTDEVCNLCHALITTYENQSHTGVVMRACTDVNCHGNNVTSQNNAYPVAGWVGPNLSAYNNAHAIWFDLASNYSSKHLNDTGQNYTKGFYACLGCHTFVEVDINLTQVMYDHSDSTLAKNRYV